MQEQEQIFFCPEDNEIIKSKTCEVQTRILNSFYSELSEENENRYDNEKVHQCNSACSSNSLQSSRTLPENCNTHLNYEQQFDFEILTIETKKILSFILGTHQNWIDHFITKCSDLQEFFKDCPFNQLVEQSIQTENQQMQKGIVLTLDYFTNLATFILYLLWKNIQNENQTDMGNFVSCSNSIPTYINFLIEYRFIEIKSQQFLIELLKRTQSNLDIQNLDEATSPSILIGMSQNHKILPSPQENEILPWSPSVVAQIMSLKNQKFYAELSVKIIISKEGLKNYFKRMNTLSQYIIYSVVKNPCKHKRQEALNYWIELAENLQQQNDLEGVFVIYKYGIQILLKDYLPQMPLLFKHQSRLSKINCYYEQQIIDNFKNSKSKGFCIPSFQKYQTQIKRLEQQAKYIRVVFEQIAPLIEQLVQIQKQQKKRQQEMNYKLNFNEQQIVRFLNFGIQEIMEKSLKTPLDKNALVYIQLIRLAKIMN